MYKDISNGYTLIRRMKIINILQKISLVLTIIGAINCGLIGLFNFNLVYSLFGVDSFLSMLIYILVGIAGIINIMLLFTDLDTK